MKTVLAIVCSLLLAWTNIVLAQAPGASVASAAPCCHCGGKKACCAAKHSLPEPLPVSAAPTFSSQNSYAPLVAATFAWALPDGPADEAAPRIFLISAADGVPLFARDCARLI